MAGAKPHDSWDPIPFLISLTVHLGLGSLLYAAAQLWGVGLLLPGGEEAGWLVEVTVPVDPDPDPEPVVEPDPDPEPVVEPDPDPEPVTRTETPKEPRVARTTTPTPPTPVAPVLDPAPGPVDPRTPAPVYRLPDQGEGGSIPVPEGRPPPRGPYGTGGDGTGTGGGGGSEQGAGPPAPPPPVSVAAIKRRAKPIGDTDFVDAHDDYPPEAKRQGIEGQVKVRLVVDATGAVAERRLVKKLGYGLDELAMQLAKRLRFEPAIDTNDSPVRSVVVWTFNFTLPG